MKIPINLSNHSWIINITINRQKEYFGKDDENDKWRIALQTPDDKVVLYVKYDYYQIILNSRNGTDFSNWANPLSYVIKDINKDLSEVHPKGYSYITIKKC